MTELKRISRRTTLKWLSLSAASGVALTSGVSSACFAGDKNSLGTSATPDLKGYGTDPDLFMEKAPWKLTLTDAQRELTAVLADMILPADDTSPAASSLGVHDFIDEWVSAPYPAQQTDRKFILNGLDWLQQESLSRNNVSFVKATQDQREAILDLIAWKGRVGKGLGEHAHFFNRFRYLTASAYFATEEGMELIGFMGNQPMDGEYPGPTPEAISHLEKLVAELGLESPFSK